MTEDDYQAYLAKAIPEYAAERIQAGNYDEADALNRSRKEFEQYLPQGIHTPRNFVGKLQNEIEQTVGYLWYGFFENRPDNAFIFDFEIYPDFRRRGYASQALATLEVHAKEHGAKKLELHVFGSNTAARELYKKVGFIETNINMAKEI
jgi:ribosomal protein S18 acetylase RimI-like enzyme